MVLRGCRGSVGSHARLSAGAVAVMRWLQRGGVGSSLLDLHCCSCRGHAMYWTWRPWATRSCIIPWCGGDGFFFGWVLPTLVHPTCLRAIRAQRAARPPKRQRKEASRQPLPLPPVPRADVELPQPPAAARAALWPPPPPDASRPSAQTRRRRPPARRARCWMGVAGRGAGRAIAAQLGHPPVPCRISWPVRPLEADMHDINGVSTS